MATIKTPYVVENDALIASVVVVVQIVSPWTLVWFRPDASAMA
jgi:hypothetical protein